MKTLLTTFVALGLVTTVGVNAADHSRTRARERTVTGTWTVTLSGGAHGETVMTLALKQDGTRVTGTLTTPHGDVPFAGRFAEDKLEIESSANDSHTPKVAFNATLKEDGTLAGYMSGDRGDATLTAVRDKDSRK